MPSRRRIRITERKVNIILRIGEYEQTSHYYPVIQNHWISSQHDIRDGPKGFVDCNIMPGNSRVKTAAHFPQTQDGSLGFHPASQGKSEAVNTAKISALRCMYIIYMNSAAIFPYQTPRGMASSTLKSPKSQPESCPD